MRDNRPLAVLTVITALGVLATAAAIYFLLGRVDTANHRADRADQHAATANDRARVANDRARRKLQAVHRITRYHREDQRQIRVLRRQVIGLGATPATVLPASASPPPTIVVRPTVKTTVTPKPAPTITSTATPTPTPSPTGPLRTLCKRLELCGGAS